MKKHFSINISHKESSHSETVATPIGLHKERELREVENLAITRFGCYRWLLRFLILFNILSIIGVALETTPVQLLGLQIAFYSLAGLRIMNLLLLVANLKRRVKRLQKKLLISYGSLQIATFGVLVASFTLFYIDKGNFDCKFGQNLCQNHGSLVNYFLMPLYFVVVDILLPVGLIYTGKTFYDVLQKKETLMFILYSAMLKRFTHGDIIA